VYNVDIQNWENFQSGLNWNQYVCNPQLCIQGPLMINKSMHSGTGKSVPYAFACLVALMVACGTSGPTPSTGNTVVNEPAAPSIDEPATASVFVEDEAVGQQSDHLYELSIPANPEVPPADVIGQLALFLGGGGLRTCHPNIPDENGLFTLDHCPADTNLVILVYKQTADVLMYAYGMVGELPAASYVTQWRVHTDNNGVVDVMMDGYNENYYFAVLNEETGEEISSEGSANPQLEGDCQSKRIKPNMAVQVTFTDGLPLRMRSHPELDSEIEERIPEGQQLETLRGPICYDDLIWWEVEYASETGWVAEKDGTRWLLEPLR
jgi:hypothetical protein